MRLLTVSLLHPAAAGAHPQMTLYIDCLGGSNAVCGEPTTITLLPPSPPCVPGWSGLR